ncbi:unnamed protein product [Nippostrongylus brasiliensis]|uniref:Uncharacterized protein n=1 Tax=Nippostrongylus brasiliensis TaxID=27835 RepID=A0A0N4YWJ6_NIPBR|nr:unnamed protein product [Nippostrongylus brasiliensis]
MADFGLRRKRAFDRIARAEFGLEGFRKKRAFDRLSIADFGLRRKRAFDRVSGTEFGLIKRSADFSDPVRVVARPDLPPTNMHSSDSILPESAESLEASESMVVARDADGSEEGAPVVVAVRHVFNSRKRAMEVSRGAD